MKITKLISVVLCFLLLFFSSQYIKALTNEEVEEELKNMGPTPLPDIPFLISTLRNDVVFNYNYTEYTEDYVLIPILPPRYNNIEGITRAWNEQSFWIDYNTCSIPSNSSLRICIFLNGRINTQNYETGRFDIVSEPYTKDNWKQAAVSPPLGLNATRRIDLVSEKGKDLIAFLSIERAKYYYTIYGITEDNFLYYILLSVDKAESVSTEEQNKWQEGNLEMIKKLADEMQLVKIPLNATKEEYTALLSDVAIQDFEWISMPQPSASENNSSESDNSMNESKEESNGESIFEESLNGEFSSEVLLSESINEFQTSSEVLSSYPDTNESVAENENDSNTTLNIVASVSLILVIVGIIGIFCRMRNRK